MKLVSNATKYRWNIDNLSKSNIQNQICCILFDAFLDHVNFWGSKTRVCVYWKKNVMMKEQKDHEVKEWARLVKDDHEKTVNNIIKRIEEEEKEWKEEEEREKEMVEESEEEVSENKVEEKRKLRKGGDMGVAGRTRSRRIEEDDDIEVLNNWKMNSRWFVDNFSVIFNRFIL